jgi:hypothetical protein
LKKHKFQRQKIFFLFFFAKNDAFGIFLIEKRTALDKIVSVEDLIFYINQVSFGV